jgi:hypothetical protein
MLISIGKFNVTFSTTFFFTQLNKASFFFEKHCGGDPHIIKTLINLGSEKVYLQIN